MGCVFCVTGQFGFARNLEAGEIVEQVLRFSTSARPVTNVVFMGMGEPLANYDETLRAIRLLTHPDGLHLGARRITLSTVGPGARRCVGLPTKACRSGWPSRCTRRTTSCARRLMPINRRWPIAEVLAAADVLRRAHRAAGQLRVHADGRRQRLRRLADDLAALLRGRLCHVNLIPLNPTEDPICTPRPRSAPWRSRRACAHAGVAATIRVNRGRDILAACGQLRLAERSARAPIASCAV